MTRILIIIRKYIFLLINPNFRNARVILFGIPKLINSKNITLGCGIRINDEVFIHADGEVILHDNVTISFGTSILTTGYDIDNWRKNCLIKTHVKKQVEINKNVWICANCTILPGVSIAEGCVVLPGSVVSKSLIEEYCLYGGIPATKIKELK